MAVRVINFYQEGCMGCEEQAPVLDEVRQRLGIVIEQIDAVKNPQYIKKYRFRQPHTLVIEDYKVRERMEGFVHREDLEAAIRRHPQPGAAILFVVAATHPKRDRGCVRDAAGKTFLLRGQDRGGVKGKSPPPERGPVPEEYETRSAITWTGNGYHGKRCSVHIGRRAVPGPARGAAKTRMSQNPRPEDHRPGGAPE